MITTLDTVSWAQELVTGNAEFIESPSTPTGTFYVVSNVRANSGSSFSFNFGNNFGPSTTGFEVLESAVVPPSPGPGSSFVTRATYNFPQPNTDFDPVAALDTSNGLLHIIGTRNTPTSGTASSPQLNDLIKFTYNISTHVLTGPIVISTGARVRGAFDIVVLANSNYVVAYCTIGTLSPNPLLHPLADNLIVAEYTSGDALVSSTTLLSSPTRTGDAFDAVSLVTPDSNNIELYYESHPKAFTFVDQVFSINLLYRIGSIWSGSPVVLTSFTARYADNRLTVIADSAGNRYMSQTYWTQQNHPEGIIGNVLLGFSTALPGFGSNFGFNFGFAAIAPLGFGFNFGFNFGEAVINSWTFHPTFGTTLGGSVIQSTLSIDQNLQVSLAYLLQPFDAIPAPPTAAAWPFHISSVAIPTLVLTEVPGFYNSLNFTWLRGTKSLVDNSSTWAVVGEREIETQAVEVDIVPAHAPFTILPAHAASFAENVIVAYTFSGTPLVQILVESPGKGQYYVEDSSGLYVFNVLDAGAAVTITYNYISGILPVFASLFNVPPIANVTPTSVTLWRDTTFYATDVSEITSFSITGNVVTAIAANDFTPGVKVAIYGFQGFTNSFLNGHTLTVLTASATQFTANFTHPDYAFVLGSGFR